MNKREQIEQALRGAKMTDDSVTEQMITALREVIGVGSADTTEVALGASKLGGQPHLPSGSEWPDDEQAFIAQINFADVSSNGRLPESGLLSVFATFDESELEPELDATLIYTTDLAGLEVVEFPDDMDEEGMFLERPLAFGTSYILSSENDAHQERFQGEDESTFRKLLRSHGCPTEAAMFCPPHFYDEDLEAYVEDNQLILKLDGGSLWRGDDDKNSIYGEGTFFLFLSEENRTTPNKADVIFEGGT